MKNKIIQTLISSYHNLADYHLLTTAKQSVKGRLLFKIKVKKDSK